MERKVVFCRFKKGHKKFERFPWLQMFDNILALPLLSDYKALRKINKSNKVATGLAVTVQ